MKRPLRNVRPFGPIVRESIEGQWIVDIQPIGGGTVDPDAQPKVPPEPTDDDIRDVSIEFTGQMTSRKDIRIPAYIRREYDIDTGDIILFTVYVRDDSGNEHSTDMQKEVNSRRGLGISTRSGESSIVDKYNVKQGDDVTIEMHKIVSQ